MLWVHQRLSDVEASVFCLGAEDGAARGARLSRELDANTTRPEWCWRATDDTGRIGARLYWWGRDGAVVPAGVELVSTEDSQAAVDLLVAARERLGVEEAWSVLSTPVEQGAVTDVVGSARDRVLAAAGFELEVERVTLAWSPEAGVGAHSGRLRFVAARHFRDELLVALFAAVSDGSLDHGMAAERAALGVDGEARQRLEMVRAYRGEAEWFSVALTPAGEPVGYVVPGRATDAAMIGEIGIAAAHRGRRYVDDLLAWGTGVLSAAGERTIIADTDLANAPMRAAFARGGYRQSHWRYDYRWRLRPARHAHSPFPPARSLLTSRLVLSPLRRADADEMVLVLSDPELYRYIGGAPPSLADLLARYGRLVVGASSDGSQHWCNWVLRSHDGTAVGMLQATVTAPARRAELAWMTARPWWGHGYAGEAAAEVAGWLHVAGVDELVAHIHPGNLASEGVARRLGLVATDVVVDGERRWRSADPGQVARGEASSS